MAGRVKKQPFAGRRRASGTTWRSSKTGSGKRKVDMQGDRPPYPVGEYRVHVLGGQGSVVESDEGPQFSTEFTLKLLDMVQSLQDENHRLKQTAASQAGYTGAGGMHQEGGTHAGSEGDRASNIPKEFVIDDLEEQLNTTTSAYEGALSNVSDLQDRLEQAESALRRTLSKTDFALSSPPKSTSKQAPGSSKETNSSAAPAHEAQSPQSATQSPLNSPLSSHGRPSSRTSPSKTKKVWAAEAAEEDGTNEPFRRQRQAQSMYAGSSPGISPSGRRGGSVYSRRTISQNSFTHVTPC